jgi:hypothetical protein
LPPRAGCNAFRIGEECEHADKHRERASCSERHGLMGLREWNADEEDDGAEIEEDEMHRH